LKTNETKTNEKIETKSMVNETSIGSHSISHVLPFLLTIEIVNFNVHNCLADTSATSNVMPYLVSQKINDVPEKNHHTTKIIQLDNSNFKVMGKLKDVMIRLTSDPRVHKVIDIVVVDIP